ncbi:hypothetical protein [Acinetobacter sp. ANC 3813]|uniref:hypothetical protein n=1 Tax=Acinetobacter sp. ANC 3813 TaxID=1977873 RepID=UPI000A34A90A|nr:hypothetical protein [Acinetobacter sp. ANC 3813]OTG87881.1 hypothetical protein B9T34_16225 [Acinetobacter sp. ANC 3813]
MNFIFRVSDILRMLEHWMATPPNGYIGVNYGRNPRQILQKPMTEDSADLLLQWAREDIPILKNISDSELYIAHEKVNFETKRYYFVIGADRLKIKTETAETVEV